MSVPKRNYKYFIPTKRKSKRPAFTYDPQSGMMFKKNATTKSSYCASPLIIDDGFKFGYKTQDGKFAYKTIKSRVKENNSTKLYFE